MAEQQAHGAMAMRRGEGQTLDKMGEIFVESQEFISTRHVLARGIGQEQDRRAVACLHGGQDMPGQQDRSVDAEWRSADYPDNGHFAVALDFGSAVQRSRWPLLHLMTGREERGYNVIERHDRLP